MKVYCIGIGGIGLSAVAKILSHQGHEVSGSDSSKASLEKNLSGSGIHTFSSQVAENITTDLELIIYSEAVSEDNPERVRATELGIKQMNYAHALAMVSEGRRLIAITGTHGKTTVTGMLSSVLIDANLDPTIVIGSTMDKLNNQNFRLGSSEWFLAEACEYRENFLPLNPEIVLINNLEPDHIDYFKTDENYYAAYQKLIEKIPAHGWLILFKEDSNYLDLSKVKGKVMQLAKEECRKEIYTLKVPGNHNQQNAYAVSKVAEKCGVPMKLIQHGLKDFKGTWRRFEYKGEVNGAKIYDDYGHHPTEIVATIQAAREWYPDKHLTVVFQPHQYSRTHAFFEEFSHSFDEASDVWITDIYSARDTQDDLDATSSEKLVSSINNIESRYIPFDQLPVEIRKHADPYHVYLVMGAGSIGTIFDQLFD
ncbi:MAG: UDP-N-acetylmuramate--L-alanine ligase [Candidatus Gracilibacteria bacterium]|nr:UDP-N-acetylmuramate--L-alanine ligase [Candidatus Gracilibacteria bacterium]